MNLSQLAINSVSTGGADLPERLAAYAGAGFRKVEFALWHVKEYLSAGHSPADVRALLDKHGLLCIGGFEGGLETFTAPEARAANHAQIVDNARLLAAFGGTNLVVGTDGPADIKQGDPLGEMARVFAEVADEVAPFGISICIEFNWSPIVKSLRTAAEIARRSGRANVGVLFDPAHYHCTPTKFDQLTAENVAFIKHIHVNNMRDKPGELSDCNADRVLPNQPGVLDLAALFGAIEHHGYVGDFSVEMFDADLQALPPADAARRMYDSLLPLTSSRAPQAGSVWE